MVRSYGSQRKKKSLKEKPSKYLAKKVTVDGIKFDSQKEANRYVELKILERAGEIQNLQMQVPYILLPTQYETVTEYTPKTHKPKSVQKVVEKQVKYIADFQYKQDGKTIVEDVKGYRDGQAYALFKLKRKLMLYFHGIKIKEV